ncbi:MAG: hypothetical protein EHM50_02045 [Lysobacterales bacterium]|nr:MAG: hypothetical protein EHM50_02045 [Xanthomonadales bacterium]
MARGSERRQRRALARRSAARQHRVRRDVVSGAELFDMLESLGLHARPVPLAPTPFAAAAA